MELNSKGFYFSFDAFMALLVMSASLVVVGTSSEVASDAFQADTIEYQRTSLLGQDAMKLASKQSFRSFNSSFQNELMNETVITDEDLERTVLDGISLLWAARNFSYAEEATKKYFDSKIPSGYNYRLQVNEDGSKTVIYKTADVSSTDSVNSISRMVSGHSIDRPSEGFQARARALKSDENQTKVVNIPMMGSGGPNQRLLLEKKFKLNASQIHEAKIYFSAQWGQSNFNSNTVEVNGQEIDIGGNSDGDWLYKVEKNSTHIGYDRADITDEVQNGWNEFYLDFKNQNNHHVHIHPGTRLVIRYSGDLEFGSEADRDYFTDVEGEAQNKTKKGGAWITKPFFIPENSTVHNVSLRLNVENVTDAEGPDVEVYLNDARVFTENVSGNDMMGINLTQEALKGTNTLSAYVNTEVEDGEITGFTGYPGDPTIYSDPENDPGGSSGLFVNYSSPNSGLVFGKIEIVSSETVGGAKGNPRDFTDSIEEKEELRNIFVNVAQLDSRNVTLEAGENSLQHVFTSAREFATPTKIRVDPGMLGKENDYRLSEECSIKCSFLPYTSIEKHILIPSQVGYGELFDNRSAALDDAEERLEQTLGDYVEATEIDTGTVSTGNQPYLWGPASVKLVVWR